MPRANDLPFRILVLSGVPGSGKSHYAQHLTSLGWRWIDHDAVSQRAADEVEASWRAIFASLPQTQERVAGFAAQARSYPRPIVIEFGFPVSLLTVIKALQRAGATAWWFTGDATACLRAWRERWQGAQPDASWLKQVGDIADDWPRIAEVYRGNVLVTRLHDRPLSLEEIDAAIRPGGES